MAERNEVREGYHIERPNRGKAGSKLVRLIVIVLLLASAVLVAIVTWGAGNKLAGASVVQYAYIVLYVLMAFFVARWNRGVLPLAASLAMILAIFAGIAGPEWSIRGKEGYAPTPLDSAALSMVTLLIVPVQVLLIAFSMRGFTQAWNVEVEVRDGEHYHPGEQGGGQPATA